MLNRKEKLLIGYGLGLTASLPEDSRKAQFYRKLHLSRVIPEQFSLILFVCHENLSQRRCLRALTHRKYAYFCTSFLLSAVET